MLSIPIRWARIADFPTAEVLPPNNPTFSQYGFYWDYQQRTRSFYVGKKLPAGVELLVEQGPRDAVGDPKLSDD